MNKTLHRFLERADRVQSYIDGVRPERNRSQVVATLAAEALQLAVDIRALVEEVRRLSELINNPRFDEFFEAVRIEAAHQRQRWGEQHDQKKSPEDWYWTLGYLAGKTLRAEAEKRLHHVITSAALLFNWFRHLSPYSPDPNWIPQEVAKALDCIDRQEDEVGMHRQLVDSWRQRFRAWETA